MIDLIIMWLIVAFGISALTLGVCFFLVMLYIALIDRYHDDSQQP